MKNITKNIVAVVGAGVLALATQSAFATPTYINGGISFNSTAATPFTMNGGALLAGATEFTSINQTALYVSSDSGNYNVIPQFWGVGLFYPTSVGTISMTPFSFAGYNATPQPASIALWAVNGPFGFTFDATTMTASYTSSSGTGQWAFAGAGVANGPGYAATEGTWTMTASESTSGPVETAFNWDSTATAAGSAALPDGGMTVALLGGTFVGLGMLRRKLCN